MASAFSSNDEAAIQRTVEELAADPTPLELLPEVYELDRCVAWMEHLQLQRVCLQFPNRLLPDSVAVCKILKKRTAKEIYILGDTNYGSCCVDLVAAAHVPSDGLIHFDDACLPNLINPKIPLLFIFPKSEGNVEDLKNSLLAEANSHELSLLVFNCSCSHLMDLINCKLEENKKIISGKFVTGEDENFANYSSKGLCCSNCTKRTESRHKTISLGRGFCLPDEVNSQDVTVLYVGEEDSFFHSILSSWSHKFKTIVPFSPSGLRLEPNLQLDKYKKRQMFLAQQVKEASSIAIILANPADPSVQTACSHARKILSLRPNPPKIYSVAVGKPNPPKLANFQDIEVFVLLSCPNNPLLSPSTRQTEAKEFYRPIVGLGEVELAVNRNRTCAGVDYKEMLDGAFDFVPLQASDSSLEADISLLTGKVINMSTPCQEHGDGTLVAKEDNLKLANVSIGGLLANRSWLGLEPNLGNDAPSLITEGRSGIAFSYQSEPSS